VLLRRHKPARHYAYRSSGSIVLRFEEHDASYLVVRSHLVRL
jgi:hypothetical protein